MSPTPTLVDGPGIQHNNLNLFLTKGFYLHLTSNILDHLFGTEEPPNLVLQKVRPVK